METADTPIIPTPARRHRALVTGLLVAAVLTGLLAMLAVWVNRQALNTDNWTKTSDALLADPQIKEALGVYLVDELFANVDVAANLEKVLPAPVAGFSGPAAASLRQLAERAAPRLLARPRVQQAWQTANETAHRQLLRVLNGGGDVVSSNNGDVVLDVHALVDQLAVAIGIEDQVAAAREKAQGSAGTAARGVVQERLNVTLPPSSGKIVIMHSDQLAAAQDAAKAIRGLAIVLTVVSLGLFALAIALAGGWRRVALRTSGWCFVGLGLVALIARRFGGNSLVDALVSSDTVRPAVHSAWTIGTSLLYDIAAALLVYGLILVAAAWLAGPTQPAVAVRRAAAPTLRDHPVRVYGGVVLLFVLVLLWGPTPATTKPIGILLLAALIVLGLEVWRRQTVREFPDAQPGDAMRRLQERFGRRRPAEPDPAPAPRTTIEELERLVVLHDHGALDDDEFRSQKQLLLHASP